MLGDKYILQRNADAAIAQRGTDAQKNELRARLIHEAQSGMHGEDTSGNQVESLLYALRKIDLGNPDTRKQVSEFIRDERKRKGGDAGAEFEVPFKILEQNIGLAVAADATKTGGSAAITLQAGVEAAVVAGKVGAVNPSIDDETRKKALEYAKKGTSSPEKLAWNTQKMSRFSSRINTALSKLESGNNQHKALAELLNTARENPTEAAVQELQAKVLALGGNVSDKSTPDGWFGPITLESIEKIAGVQVTHPTSAPGSSTSQGGSAAGGSSATKAPSTSTTSPNQPVAGKIPNQSERTKELANINMLLAAWRAATAGADTLSNADSRKKNKELIDVALASLSSAMIELNNKYIVGQKNTEETKVLQEQLKSINNEVALYLRGEGKVANKHNRDPIAAESILKNVLGTHLNAPKFPTQDDLLAKLDVTTKSLIKSMLDTKMRSGMSFEKALGETLGNSTIKGAWDRVIENGLSQYEKDLIMAINAVDVSNLSTEEKAAHDQLKDMYGTTGWFDFKDSRKAVLVLGRDQFMAVGLGILGFALTSTGIGTAIGAPLVITASALVGGTIATTASMLMEQKIYSGEEFAQEGLINIGTFGVGGMVFKIARTASVLTKIGTAGAIGVEMAGDYAIGVSVDQIRAHFQGVDISLAESLKNNLAWALLPLVIRGVGGAVSRPHQAIANRAQSGLQEAQTRQALGDTQGANQALAQLDSEITAARQASTAAPAQGATPSTRATAQEPATQSKTQTQTQPDPVPPAAPAVQPARGENYTNYIMSRHIKKLKDGQTFVQGDVTISRVGSKFEVKVSNSNSPAQVTIFDNTTQGKTALSEHLAQTIEPKDVFKDGLNHLAANSLKGNKEKVFNVGGDTFRVRKTGDNKVVLEKQVKQGQFLTFDDFASLSPNQVDEIIEQSFGKGSAARFSTMADGLTNGTSAIGKKIHDMKVKDFFLGDTKGKDYDWVGARIPKHMYDWTIGKLIKESGKSFSLPGLKKIELLRTAFTGRSSGGHLWTHSGEWGILPSAWTPSFGHMARIGALTAFEIGLEENENNSDGRYIVNTINGLGLRGGEEFLYNHLTWIYLGVIGTTIIEAFLPGVEKDIKAEGNKLYQKVMGD